jgi:hypothetical protein
MGVRQAKKPDGAVAPKRLSAEDRALYREALVEHFSAFLKVGRISFSEWDKLGRREKLAMAIAADRVRLEEAILFGSATFGPDAVAEMASRIDGGDMKIQLALKRVNEAIALKIAPKPEIKA